MSLRLQRIFLWTCGTALLLTSASIVVFAMRAPLDVASFNLHPPPATRNTGPANHVEPSLAELQLAAKIDLRRPLFDPPPPVPVATPVQPPPPPLTVRLAGTIIEAGHNRAVLRGSDGKTELKAVGEASGPAEVLEIAPDHCVVRYLGNRVTLKIERPAAQGVGG
jgi:hypothetical protein